MEFEGVTNISSTLLLLVLKYILLVSYSNNEVCSETLSIARTQTFSLVWAG